MNHEMQSRVLTHDNLEIEINRLKASRKTIGLCHGCFDVLHFGHLIHLNEAAKQVDFLIVSVTPDQYVNKGPTRPIFGEQKRVFFLSNLRSVDCVFLNDTSDALRPLSLVNPDIYFKGADYKGHKSEGYLREETFCSSKGIRLVHTVGDRFSSTETLRLLEERI